MRGRRRANGPASVEAFRHFRLAGLRREAIACGSGAVDHLAATFQNRAALGLIEELFKLLRRSDAALRSALVLEAADLCGRIGDT